MNLAIAYLLGMIVGGGIVLAGIWVNFKIRRKYDA